MGSALVELIIHFYREDGIAVANEKAVSMIGWNCVSKLLQGPLRRWVRGEIAVQDAPRPKLHEEEHIQDSKPRCNDNEEIAGDNGLSMIADKRLPVLREGSVWSRGPDLGGQ